MIRKFVALVILVIFSGAIGYFWRVSDRIGVNEEIILSGQVENRAILRVALVADSHNENDLLEKALRQVGGVGVNFVIGLGDYTNLGTIDELKGAKEVFDRSGLVYYLTAGDRDGWQSRNNNSSESNFFKVFNSQIRVIDKERVQFILIDNSDIYKGIDSGSWSLLAGSLDKEAKLKFVFAHKTPYHPQSSHIMGEDSRLVSSQAERLMVMLQDKNADGFFSGDLHFFAKFQTPDKSVKISTIGAIASERNFQGPRFGLLTIFDDYSWEVEDVEIR